VSVDRELANGFRPTVCIQRTTTCASANYQSCFLTHGEAGAPRHKHVQLEGQFRSLVHILCVWQGLQWNACSAIIFIASDVHISYIYIYIYTCHGHVIFIFNFITAQTYGHNFGHDARWRGSSAEHVCCWRRSAVCWVLAGRGATRARSAAPKRPRLVRANQVRPCTCGRWDATAPALEARRRCKQQVRSALGPYVRKRAYRYHLWLLS
jgi:hypothetical protein